VAIANHERVGNHPSVYNAYLQVLNEKTSPFDVLSWSLLAAR
jgi:hypothetical protein